MNNYAIATVSDFSGCAVFRGDATDARKLCMGTGLKSGMVRFEGMIGDDFNNMTATVSYFNRADDYTVCMYEHSASTGEVINSERLAVKSLESALRFAHGWCIAD